MNDHWAKHAHPSWLTGKLSDFAGLLFFPLFLEAMLEGALALRGRYRGPSAARLVAAVLITAVGFAFVKTSALGVQLYGVGLGALQWPFRALLSCAQGEPVPTLEPAGLIRDPSDLVAMAAFAGTALVGRRRIRSGDRPTT